MRGAVQAAGAEAVIWGGGAASRAGGFEPGLLEALQVIEQGYLWLDADLVIRGYNAAYLKLLGMVDAPDLHGQTYGEVLRLLLARGELLHDGDHAEYVEHHLRRMVRGERQVFERVRSNGTVLGVSIVPLPAGGFVYTYLDVTREAKARKELERNAKSLVVAMANVAERRDGHTGIHVLRVARLVAQTARQLRRDGHFADVIDDAYIDCVATASMLHDVGKIATSDVVLLKQGILSEHERCAIQRHTREGWQMLQQASSTVSASHYLNLGAEIALSHHEWWDGTGYPERLAGNEIPLSGRLCAIADVFDALLSRRPYKAPWERREALAEIRRLSGSQFDPVIARAFVKVVEDQERFKLVQWTDDMSVGDYLIDEQHRMLIDTINQLAGAESADDRPAVGMIIDELVNFAIYHFAYEERLMAATDMPGLEAHRATHREFIVWVEELSEEFGQFRRRVLGDRIFSYLRDWLRGHILADDKGYQPFIERSGMKTTAC